MGVAITDQETIINWMRGDEFAEVYTSDTTIMTKLDKLCKKHPENWKCVSVETINEGDIASKMYKCPRKMVSFRGVTVRPTGGGNTAALEAYRERKKLEQGQ